MAMVRVAPVTVQVRTDWFNGIPREITWGEDRLQVTRLVAVRDEARAYPAITGPRTLFEVDTPGPSPRPHVPAPIPALDDRGAGRSARQPPDGATRHGSRRLLPAAPWVGCGAGVDRARPAGQCAGHR